AGLEPYGARQALVERDNGNAARRGLFRLAVVRGWRHARGESRRRQEDRIEAREWGRLCRFGADIARLSRSAGRQQRIADLVRPPEGLDPVADENEPHRCAGLGSLQREAHFVLAVAERADQPAVVVAVIRGPTAGRLEHRRVL